MQVTKNDIDALNTKITVVVEQKDYESKFKSELEKQRQKASMKGFRKGKTPMSMIKKLYGEQVLAESVNAQLQTALYDYIKDQELEVLGDPIPEENHEVVSFNPNELKDYTFVFEAGLSPKFEVQGVSATDEYKKCEIAIEDKTVDEELMAGRKRLGTQVSIEDSIEEKDILTIEAKELEGGKPKKNGFETNFKLMTELIADEDLKKKVLKGKKGEKITFDIYKLEKDRDEAYVKKYMLNMDEEEDREVGNEFEGVISEVSRLKEADLDEEFVKKYFNNDEISTVEEAKEKIREDIAKYYDEQATKMMYRDIMEVLLDKNQMEMPEAFLKRWLAMSNDKVSPEDLEKEFPDFVKNLKWTLVKNKIAKSYDIKVEGEEVADAMRARVAGYLGQYNMGQEYMDSMVQKLMQDREQVNRLYEEIHADKMFKALEGTIKIKKEKIKLEDFQEKVKALNEKLGASQG